MTHRYPDKQQTSQEIWQRLQTCHTPSISDLEQLDAGQLRQLAAELTAEVITLRDRSKRPQQQGAAPDETSDMLQIAEGLPIGCTLVDKDLRVLGINPSAARLLGWGSSDTDSLSISRFIHEPDLPLLKQKLNETLGSGRCCDFTLRLVRKDSKPFSAKMRTSCLRRADDLLLGCLFFDSITNGYSIEEERELIADLIAQLNTADNLQNCIAKLTHVLQEWSGCEAIGVRLKNGDDYPYFETRGFPPQFVAAENSLCAYDAQGEVQRDSDGNPVLECMCGNVLQGRVDSAQPFFTANGSFWTNSTTELLTNSTKEQRQSRTRNRCNGEGYESVALIPLRTGNQTFGVLQFNDRRRNCFSPGIIQHFEKIANAVTMSLAKRQAEQQLKESEGKFRTVASYTYAMETWMLPDGSYGYVSPSCQRVTGYTQEALMGDPNLLHAMVHPEDKPRVAEHFRTSLRGNASQNMGIDFRILTPEGYTRWLSHSCIAVYNSAGEWEGRRGSFRDITKQKAVEYEQVEHGKHLLKTQKKESLDRMAAAIVHHFNNKLHVVQMYLELALEDLSQPHHARFRLAAALDALNKASDISKLMLTYLGQTTGKRCHLDVIPLCKMSVEKLKPRLHGVQLETVFKQPSIVVNTNEKYLHQILANIIVNASEAIHRNDGAIKLIADKIPREQIPEKNRFPHDWQGHDTWYACIQIHDNGCGITQEQIDNAFDPFFSTKLTGRGLGLPVALGIIHAHDGLITVENPAEGGSLFSVFLPLVIDDSIGETRDRPAHEPDIAGTGTVLVVDDDEIVLEINSVILEEMGFKVLNAKDGIEAIEKFKKHRNDIVFILTDFAMPRLNGIEMFHRLRELSPNLPVIISSGYSKEIIDEESGENRPELFLEKPFTVRDLKNIISRALQPRGVKNE